MSTLDTQSTYRYKSTMSTKEKKFPNGAQVYVDGRDLARVKTAFPEGSSSLMAPHYIVDFEGGDKNVKVSMKRIGVKPNPRRAVFPPNPKKGGASK
jgi:hypothetical protein